MLERCLRHRAPLLWIVLPLIGGLVLGRLRLSEFLSPALCLFLGLAAIMGAWFSARERPRLWAGLMVLSLVMSGVAGYRLHTERLTVWDDLPPREARLGLSCERVFVPRSPDRCSGVARVVETETHLADLMGKRLTFSLSSGSLRQSLLRGTVIEAKGVLRVVSKTPQPRSFEAYLADSGIQFRLSRGRILAVRKGPGAYRRMTARLLADMERILSHGIGEKRPQQCGAFKAMMLGQLNELNEDQNELFRQSGTMHLFSISGLHIGVIAAVLHGFLALMRLPRWLRLALCLGLLWIYVDATGSSPSAVRAFQMVTLIELAMIFKQAINSLSTLATATLVVLLFAPCQIFGASFQMSYGIVATLILFSAPLTERMLAAGGPFRLLPPTSWMFHHRLVDGAWRWTVGSLCAGLGASLVGLITGVHYFALLTPGALLVNLALIPLSSLVLVAGMMSFALAIPFGAGAAFLSNHAALVVLFIMEAIARLCLKLPGMHVAVEFSAPWFGGAALCTMLLLCLQGYRSAWKPSPWAFLGPPALLLAVLSFGVRCIQTP